MGEIVDVGSLTPGKVFVNKEGDLLSVIDVQHNKTAMAKMKHKFKVKNLRSGATSEIMYFSGDKVESAFLDKKSMQFLYSDDDFGYFMDSVSYDQIQIPVDRIKWELQFLAPEAEVSITYYEQEIIGVSLPAKVTLEIVDTDDNAVAGDTVNRAQKLATLETGYVIKVPLFVKNHQHVIVRTDTGEYDSRAD